MKLKFGIICMLFFSLIGNFEFLSKRDFKAKVILFLSIYIELIFDNIHLHFRR